MIRSLQRTLPILLMLVGAFWCTAPAFGQQDISGTVTDAGNGDTLPGASVSVPGTTVGTATAGDGSYQLTVPETADSLRFSFVGYVAETVAIGDRSVIDIALEPSTRQLEDLVVVGYQTRRQEDLTASVSTVSSDDLAASPAPTFQEALQGKASGVQITSSSGLANSPVSIRIRGTSSVNADSEPLFVVDGVPISTPQQKTTGGFSSNNYTADGTNPLSNISSQDIESVTVLKGPQATAIYGSRGANGVILIQTKSGQAGDTQINASYSVGFKQQTGLPELLNGPEYLRLLREAYENSNGSSQLPLSALPSGLSDAEDPEQRRQETIQAVENTNTDWQEQLLQTGVSHDVSLSASGGNEQTQFYVGGGFTDEEGFLEGNTFQRLNGRVNVTHEAVEGLIEVSGKLAASYVDNGRVPTGFAGGLGTAMSRSLPIAPVRLDNGNFWNPDGGTNVVAENENIDYNLQNSRITGNVSLQLTPLEDLRLEALFGTDILDQKERYFERGLIKSTGLTTSEDRDLNVDKYNLDFTGEYTTTVAEDHNINVLAGTSFERFDRRTFGLFGEGAPFSSVRNPARYSTTQQAGGDEGSFRFFSVFGTANYKYADRYLASFSARADGSSKFSPDNRYGFFPSGSVGWIVSNESFMDDIDVVSFLKLRASYGFVGNAGIGLYPYQQVYNTGANYATGSGIVPAQNLGNSSLTWESLKQTTIGLDYGFLNDRIEGSLEFYNKVSEDLLLGVNLRPTSGFTSVTDNVGSLRNRGLEFEISTRNFTGDFSWRTDFNIGWNQNEITDLSNQVLAGENFGNNFAIEGEPIGTWRLIEWAGIDPDTGEEVFYRNDGSGTTTTNGDAAEQITVGNPYPDYFGGITNTFSYKGLEVSAFFNFELGHQIFDDAGKFLAGGFDGNWNQYAAVKDRWQEPGDVTNVQRLEYGSDAADNRGYNSTRYLHDADYLRLKRVSVSYTLPSSLLNEFGGRNVNVFVRGFNLLTFTDFEFGDPELNRDNSGNITQGVTYLTPPQAKRVTVGVNIGF